MFSDILGQEKAINYLKKLVCQNRVPGALLFCGPDGVGKRKAALEFAKALNCEDIFARQNGEACGTCASCRAIEKGTHPDVTLVDFVYQAHLEMKKDVAQDDYEEEFEKVLAKQQNISIDSVRAAADKAQQKAVGAGWKVVIVDQAQTLQYARGAAANALLKFIEEPPAKTVWILITNKRAAMLSTILSRCQLLLFAPLSTAHIMELLQKNAPEVADPQRAARYGGGSVSGTLRAAEALELLEEGDFGTVAGPTQVAAGLSRTAATARKEAQAVLDVLVAALHEKWSVCPEQERAALQNTLHKFEDYKRSIGRNVSPALVLETALMSLDGLNLKI